MSIGLRPKSGSLESRQRSGQSEGHLLEGQILPTQSSSGIQTRGGSGGPQKLGGYLSHVFPRVCYSELGDLYLDKLNKHHLTWNLVHRLERLGYIVTMTSGLDAG